MTRRTAILAAAGLLLAGAAASARGGDEPSEILDRLRKKYDGVKDAAVTFTQQVTFGATQSEASFGGTLLLRKGGKYRVETDQETIVTDGASIWSYNKSTHQLFIDRYRDDPLAVSPDKVLVDVAGRYTASLVGTEGEGKEALTVLKLIPRERKARIRWMKVWVDTDAWLLRRVQVFDLGENLTTYSVRDARLNAGVPDSAFTFPTPAGADVIDLR